MKIIEKNVSSYEKFQIIKEYTENNVSLLIISQQKIFPEAHCIDG